MVSRLAQNALAEMLMAIGTGERELESFRQTICAIEEFNMRNAFERLDQAGIGYLTAHELLNFLLENNVDKANMEAVQKVFAFYDCNEDDNWSIREFNQMILPCERAELARKVVKRNYPGRLPRGQRLPQIQERLLLCIVELEVAMQQKIMKRSRDFNCEGLDIGDKSVFRSVLAASGAGSTRNSRSSSSYIDLSRFDSFMRLNGHEPSQNEILGIIRRMDRTGDMKITYPEWRDFFSPRNSRSVMAEENRPLAAGAASQRAPTTRGKKSSPLRKHNQANINNGAVVSMFSPGPPPLSAATSRNKPSGSYNSCLESQRTKMSRQPKQALNTPNMMPMKGGDSSHRAASYRCSTGKSDMQFVSSFGRNNSKPRENSTSLSMLKSRSNGLMNHARQSSTSGFQTQSIATGATPSFPLGGNNIEQITQRPVSPHDPRSASPYGDGRHMQSSQSNTYGGQLSPGVLLNPSQAIHFQSHADSHLMHSFEAGDLVNNSRLISGLDRSFANSPIMSTDQPRNVYAVHDGSTGNVPIRQAPVGNGIKSKNVSRGPLGSRQHAVMSPDMLHMQPNAQSMPQSGRMPLPTRKRIDGGPHETGLTQRSSNILSQRSDVPIGGKRGSVEPVMEHELKMASRLQIYDNMTSSPLRASYRHLQNENTSEGQLTYDENMNTNDDINNSAFVLQDKNKSKKLRQLEERIRELTFEQSRAEAQKKYLEMAADTNSSNQLNEEDKVNDSAEQFVGRVRESSARLRQIELKLKELRSSKAQKPRKNGHVAQPPREPQGSSSKLDRFKRRSRNPDDDGAGYDGKRDDIQMSKPLRNNFVAINTNSSHTNEALTHRGQQPRDGGRSSRTEPMGKQTTEPILECAREASKHGSEALRQKDQTAELDDLKGVINQQGHDDEIELYNEDVNHSPLFHQSSVHNSVADQRNIVDPLPQSRINLLEQMQRNESNELTPLESAQILQIDEMSEAKEAIDEDEEEDRALKEDIRRRQQEEREEELRQKQLQAERELQRLKEKEELAELERQLQEQKKINQQREQEREAHRQRLLKQRKEELQKQLEADKKREEEAERLFLEQTKQMELEKQQTFAQIKNMDSVRQQTPKKLTETSDNQSQNRKPTLSQLGPLIEVEYSDSTKNVAGSAGMKQGKSLNSKNYQKSCSEESKVIEETPAYTEAPLNLNELKPLKSSRSQHRGNNPNSPRMMRASGSVKIKKDKSVMHPVGLNMQKMSSVAYQMNARNFGFGGLNNDENEALIEGAPALTERLGARMNPVNDRFDQYSRYSAMSGHPSQHPSYQRSFDGKHMDFNQGVMIASPTSKISNWIIEASNAQFPARAGRYHLYVNLGCPWSCSCLAVLYLKGLDNVITVSNTRSELERMPDGRMGWVFDESDTSTIRPELSSKDFVLNCSSMQEVYQQMQPDFKGPFTVPCLVDKTTMQIVNNDSGDICKMLSKNFNQFASKKTLDFYPENLQEQIDKVDQMLKKDIMEGVYLAGFAKTQEHYDAAVTAVFEQLNTLDKKLAQNDFLVADRLTYVDIRLFQFLIRFDPVFFLHFKCNKKTLRSYNSLNRYVKHLYHQENLGKFVDMDQIKRHFYRSHPAINPSGIIPIGPDAWWLDKDKKQKDTTTKSSSNKKRDR